MLYEVITNSYRILLFLQHISQNHLQHILYNRNRRITSYNVCYTKLLRVTGIGQFSVKAPRVDDRKLPTTEERFTSKILPKYMRKIPTVDNLLPVLYLKGISSNGFQDVV